MRTEFLNKLCPVCGIAFKDGDDIVVCPICGTPHHRACYAQENKCGVESYHSEGFVWDGYLPGEKRPEINHGNDNIPENSVGYDHNPENFTGVDPMIIDFIHRVGDSTIGEDGVSMRELTTFASRSLFHYEQAFRLFRGGAGRKKRTTFFNICSGLLAPTFQFYRKMDILGIILIVIMLLPSLLIALNESFFVNNSAALVLFNFLSIAEQVLLCVFGDFIYYHHAIKKIIRIRQGFKDNANSDEYYAALEAAGRPSVLRAIVGTLIFVLGACAILIIPGVQ